MNGVEVGIFRVQDRLVAWRIVSPRMSAPVFRGTVTGTTLRSAVYEYEHADVEWTLKSLEADLDAEQVSLNRRFLSRKRAIHSFVNVEDAAQVENAARSERPQREGTW